MLTRWHLREIFKNYFHAIRIIYFDSIYVYNYLNILWNNKTSLKITVCGISYVFYCFLNLLFLTKIIKNQLWEKYWINFHDSYFKKYVNSICNWNETKFGIINGKMYEKRPQRNKIFKSRYLRSTKYPNIWISNNRNSRTHYSINIKFGRDVKKT